ncbi:MAG: acetyl-CoA carboxylase biotin carboxyl carrier protein, partial [candidate division Zixibacteria bacterium]|nr:acetyl-CoA carboxylase biotin carboxyl carrier protein [candidate division Zixibacteria bacterium]
MNENYIKKLIRLVEESEIESLEVSSWGRKIKITQKMPGRTNGHSETAPVLHSVAASQPAVAVNAPPHVAVAPPPSAPVEETANVVAIKSPMVGTFYSSPSPDSPPYVSLNERVTVGQVVCIVEAMKLMNEIESEVSGRVTRVMAENGKPVEFGQVLF